MFSRGGTIETEGFQGGEQNASGAKPDLAERVILRTTQGKKKYDKREAIKRKDIQRTKERGIYEE